METLFLSMTVCLRQLRADDATDIFEAIDTQRPYLGHWLPFVEQTRQAEDSVQFVTRTILAVPYEYTFTLRSHDQFVGRQVLNRRTAQPFLPKSATG